MINYLKLAEEIISEYLDGYYGNSDKVQSWYASKEERQKISDQWDDHDHVVSFTKSGWSVQHPLVERLHDGSLFKCSIDPENWEWNDERPEGLFRARFDPSWACWDFEPVNNGES